MQWAIYDYLVLFTFTIFYYIFTAFMKLQNYDATNIITKKREQCELEENGCSILYTVMWKKKFSQDSVHVCEN